MRFIKHIFYETLAYSLSIQAQQAKPHIMLLFNEVYMELCRFITHPDAHMSLLCNRLLVRCRYYDYCCAAVRKWCRISNVPCLDDKLVTGEIIKLDRTLTFIVSAFWILRRREPNLYRNHNYSKYSISKYLPEAHERHCHNKHKYLTHKCSTNLSFSLLPPRFHPHVFLYFVQMRNFCLPHNFYPALVSLFFSYSPLT